MRAINEATKTLAKKKRVNQQLTQRRQFLAEMKQDDLKIAIEWAENPDRPRRDYLLEMFATALRDGHLQGEMGKAIHKVVGSNWSIFKKGTDTVDELATRLLQKTWFEDYRTYFEEARFYGHSLVQFLDKVPSTEKGIQNEFKNIDLIRREHVRPEEGYIVLDVSHETGIPFRDKTIKKQLMLIEMGKPTDLGLMPTLLREFIWKNYSRSDWSRHSEKFGMPFLIVKLATTNEKEIQDAENMARNFGNNLWGIFDPEDQIELKESVFKDSFNMYKEKALMCNDETSKAVSWQTGTSDEKAYVGGAEVHERVLNDYVEWRKRKQAYHINEDLFPFLVENGYPLQDSEFRYYIPEDQQGEDKETDNPKGQGGGPAKKPQASGRLRLRMM